MSTRTMRVLLALGVIAALATGLMVRSLFRGATLDAQAWPPGPAGERGARTRVPQPAPPPLPAARSDWGAPLPSALPLPEFPDRSVPTAALPLEPLLEPPAPSRPVADMDEAERAAVSESRASVRSARRRYRDAEARVEALRGSEGTLAELQLMQELEAAAVRLRLAEGAQDRSGQAVRGRRRQP